MSPQQQSPHVIHMNRFRKNSVVERIVAALAYLAFMYLSTMHDMITFLLLFLLVWVITQNKTINAPPFIKYHVAQAFALGMMGEAVKMLLHSLMDVLQKTAFLLEAINFGNLLGNVWGLILQYWIYLILAVAAFHMGCALLGKRQAWPLSGDIARQMSHS
jgi:hypothetical protein